MVVYAPFTTKIGKLPLIVYPAVGLESVLPREEGAVLEHLRSLYSANRHVKAGFHVVVPWALESALMTDVFALSNLTGWKDAYNVDSLVYSGLERVTDAGIGCSDEMLVAGTEDLHRRTMFKTMGAFLKAPRPVLPMAVGNGQPYEIR